MTRAGPAWRNGAMALVLAGLLPACGESPAEPVRQPVDRVDIYFTRNGRPEPVSRSIAPTFSPLLVSLNLLLSGPTQQERDAGYTSLFGDRTATALSGITMRPDSLATIEFLDFTHIVPEGSTAQGSAQLLGELNNTVFQFTFVKSIVYRINGSCSRFWNWLNRACETVRRPGAR